jgi:hypothetical protein
MSAPWYAHLATGAVGIAAGLGLVVLGQTQIGSVVVGSGVTFLGIGAGVATVPTSTAVVKP